MLLSQVAFLVLVVECIQAFPHELDPSALAKEHEENPLTRVLQDAERTLSVYAPRVKPQESADEEGFRRDFATSYQIRSPDRLKRVPFPMPIHVSPLEFSDIPEEAGERKELAVKDCFCAVFGDEVMPPKTKGLILESVIPKRSESALTLEQPHSERKPIAVPDCECIFEGHEGAGEEAASKSSSLSSRHQNTHSSMEASSLSRNKRAPLPTPSKSDALDTNTKVHTKDDEEFLIETGCHCGVAGSGVETAVNFGLQLTSLSLKDNKGLSEDRHDGRPEKFIVDDCSCMFRPRDTTRKLSLDKITMDK